jgi:hypothetical protein
MNVTGRDPICQEICEALGLKHVRALSITMMINNPVEVSASFHPEKDALKLLIPILKRYSLMEIET